MVRFDISDSADGFCVSQIQINQEQRESVFHLSSEDRCDDVISVSKDSVSAGIRIHRERSMIALELFCDLSVLNPQFGCQQDAIAKQDGVVADLFPEQEAPYVSIYQHMEWWLRPGFGSLISDIPKRSQCIIRKIQNHYEIYLAVSGKNCRADMKGEDGKIRLSLSSNKSGLRSVRDIACVYASGPEPYSLLEEMVVYALKLSGKGTRIRKDKGFPEIFDKWGWCSWDSLGQDVSEDQIFKKMDDFRDLGIRVPWVLIDDGWSETNREKQILRSFREDPQRFPSGLAHTVQVLKEQYHVEHVGVWQAAKGYWNGIEPYSEAYCEAASFLRTYPNGEITYDAAPWACFAFWDRWQSNLEKQGISFVKIDSQSSWSLMTKSLFSYGETAQALHKGIEASSDLHFGGNLINCMGMAPEDMWNRYSAMLSRSSDDYRPREMGSFREHALQNGYNSILQGCFFWGDWDMVWSCHKESRESLLLRAISGGPFYVSDAVGRTDVEAILPLIADDGRVLRCDDVGRPTLDCLTDPSVLKTKALKIYNRYRENIYVAVFWDDMPEDCRDVLHLKDIPAADPEKTYWVYDQEKRTVSLYDPAKGYPLQAENRQAYILALIPAESEICIVGLAEKYISGAAVEIIAPSASAADGCCNAVGGTDSATGDGWSGLSLSCMVRVLSTGTLTVIKGDKLHFIPCRKAGEIFVL